MEIIKYFLDDATSMENPWNRAYFHEIGLKSTKNGWFMAKIDEKEALIAQFPTIFADVVPFKINK